jgi:hypothetical protein
MKAVIAAPQSEKAKLRQKHKSDFYFHQYGVVVGVEGDYSSS